MEFNRSDNFFEIAISKFFNTSVDAGVPGIEGVGIILTVKAEPALEDFMRGLGDQSADGVSAYGREWIPLTPEPLQIYDMSKTLAVPGVTFTHPGHLLKVQDGNFSHPNGLMNLSFLRLKGISQPGGLRFGIKTVYNKTEAGKLADDLAAAGQLFVNEYLCPIDIIVGIVGYRR